MEFSKQEQWSGLPFPSPGDLPNPGISAHLLHCQMDSLPLSHLERPLKYYFTPIFLLFSFLFWTVCHYVTYLCMYFFLPHHSGNCKRADRYFALFTDVSLMPVLHMTHGELSTNSCRREEVKEEGR